jgi:hypothetical protein
LKKITKNLKQDNWMKAVIRAGYIPRALPLRKPAQSTPYLRMYKPHFMTRIYPPKLGCGLCTEYYVLLTTEPATPVLCIVKLPVETVSIWDLSCTRAKSLTYNWCIGIFWLHETSGHHQFPEVGRPWHHWQITVNAASDNQSAANAIANILISHR